MSPSVSRLPGLKPVGDDESGHTFTHLHLTPQGTCVKKKQKKKPPLTQVDTCRSWLREEHNISLSLKITDSVQEGKKKKKRQDLERTTVGWREGLQVCLLFRPLWECGSEQVPRLSWLSLLTD